MLQINQKARTSGFGMGDQAEVSGSIGMGQLILASGITAAVMAAAAIVVEGVKYYWFRDEDDGVVLRSNEGVEVKFKTIKDAQKAKDQLERLIQEATVEAEKKAMNAEEEDSEKAAEKTKTDKKAAA